MSVTVDDGSRGTDDDAGGTDGGGSAQVTTQQQQQQQQQQQEQAVAAVTLAGMWLSGNGSTVYMCVESLPDDGR